jgi:hypothetical protein
MCGGPPGSQIRMTDVSANAASAARAARRRSNWGSVKPPAKSEPISRKLRRETGPRQKHEPRSISVAPKRANSSRLAIFAPRVAGCQHALDPSCDSNVT